MQVPLPLHCVFVFDPPRLPAARLPWSPLLWLALAAALAAAGVAIWWLARPPADGPRPAGAPLASTPPGATLLVDGEDRGRAPTTVRVQPGRHRVVTRLPDHLEASADADVPPAGTSLALELWRREPLATRVRPTFPGAIVAGASFLADGRAALTARGVPIPLGGALTSEPLPFGPSTDAGRPIRPGCPGSPGAPGTRSSARSCTGCGPRGRPRRRSPAPRAAGCGRGRFRPARRSRPRP